MALPFIPLRGHDGDGNSFLAGFALGLASIVVCQALLSLHSGVQYYVARSLLYACASSLGG